MVFQTIKCMTPLEAIRKFTVGNFDIKKKLIAYRFYVYINMVIYRYDSVC